MHEPLVINAQGVGVPVQVRNQAQPNWASHARIELRVSQVAAVPMQRVSEGSHPQPDCASQLAGPKVLHGSGSPSQVPCPKQPSISPQVSHAGGVPTHRAPASPTTPPPEGQALMHSAIHIHIALRFNIHPPLPGLQKLQRQSKTTSPRNPSRVTWTSSLLSALHVAKLGCAVMYISMLSPM